MRMANEEESRKKTNPKLTLFPLIALIFYNVSGGPFGVEDSVKSGGGPLLPILGFLIFPFIWSIPEALVTAELATTFPENGGYVIWISSAFGPFWGFQLGFWKWVSGVIDNALYPVLFLDYLKHSIPLFANVFIRIPTLFALTSSLTYLNYRGLHIVGAWAVFLAIFSLLPFVAMAILAIPRINPRNWIVVDLTKVNLRGFFNNLFWNLNYWDKASTLAGEVDNPSKILPKALFGAVIMVSFSYLIPILSSTGAVFSSSSNWSDGYFSEVGFLIGGAWLQWWIQLASAMSNFGLFEAEMSGDSFQLLGMSELGMLPSVFAARSKYGTPTLSILCSSVGIASLSWMSFQDILEFENFLYSIGMLFEFASFIYLRIYRGDLVRPFKVPFANLGVSLFCLPPSILLVFVMMLCSLKTVLVCSMFIGIGFCVYPLLLIAKSRRWVEFKVPQLEEVNSLLPILAEDEVD